MKIFRVLFVALTLLSSSSPAWAARDGDDDVTPPGMTLTPLAIPGAKITRLGTLDGTAASPAITNPSAIAVNPDGSVLAVLTSGYNGMALPNGEVDAAHSTERLMVFRIGSSGATKIAEVPLLATFSGLAWSPDGKRLAVTLGVIDAVAVYRWDGTSLMADGAPIGRLYSAGELGSIYSFLYQGGGNIGECFAFGRIAGRNAAAEVPLLRTQASLLAAE